MELNQALKNVAVLGAAGKMGSGISLLILQEMANRSLKSKEPHLLNLIDVNAQAFPQLRSYLKDQLVKYAEKNINQLRNHFADQPTLISNEDIIEAYVDKALNLVFFNTSVEAAKEAHLIFEAIVEDEEIKSKVFNQIVQAGNKTGFFLSNTSSIPLQVINEKAKLNNRLIGFHFYNPPPIQKLLEIITPTHADPHLIKIAFELAQHLKKTVVQSKDVAGFIGNGHMMREIAFACQKVQDLSKNYSLPEAIYIVNRVTHDWLIRPMGIFQLIDYVGLDVCQHISQVMHSYLNDPSLKIDLIDQMVKEGILGGQRSDGTQKDGFFSYAKHTLTGIYSLPKQHYLLFSDTIWIISADRDLGELPKDHLTWKAMQKHPEKEKLLQAYMKNLYSSQTLGAQLAQEFLKNSNEISDRLTQEGIANSKEDVNTVLTNGFYHLYGT